MKKSAFNFDIKEEPPFVESIPQVQALDVPKIIVYEPAAPLPVSTPKRSSEKEGRRRRKLIRFVKIESVALFFLVLTLAGAASEPLRKLGLEPMFQVGIFASALAVALVPVILYGLPREKYRYRSRRPRRR